MISPFIALSQRGGTSRSTQHHIEENQIYASADEGKSSAHMVLTSPPFFTFSSFYISRLLHSFRLRQVCVDRCVLLTAILLNGAIHNFKLAEIF